MFLYEYNTTTNVEAGTLNHMSTPPQQTIPYADHFDNWCSYYDSTPEANAIQDTIYLNQATVVETACGTGRLSFELAPTTQDYIGLDEDPRLITKATEKPHDWDTPLSFGISAQEHLPLQDNTADVIISSWGTDHTTIGHILTEYHRVLKPGGSLIIIEEDWNTEHTESDYATLLQHVHPEYPFYNTNSGVTDIITEATTDPIETQSIESTYTYPSLEAAIDAFTFHITGLQDRGLSLHRQSLLELMLAGFEQDNGTIELSEQATLSHYILDP